MNVGVILDEMPKNCGHCQLTHKYYELHCISCDGIDGTKPNNADDGLIGIYYDDGPYEYEIYERKPDWCPLQEVEPVTHGKWKYDLDGFYICTVCGNKERVAEKMCAPIWEYCPWCGAKMEGEA